MQVCFRCFCNFFFRRYQLYNWKLQVYMYNITNSLIFDWHLTVSNNLLLFFSDDMVGFLKRKENTLIKIWQKLAIWIYFGCCFSSHTTNVLFLSMDTTEKTSHSQLFWTFVKRFNICKGEFKCSLLKTIKFLYFFSYFSCTS